MTYQRLNQGYRGRFRTNFEMFGRMTEALVFRVCSEVSFKGESSYCDICYWGRVPSRLAQAP